MRPQALLFIAVLSSGCGDDSTATDAGSSDVAIDGPFDVMGAVDGLEAEDISDVLDGGDDAEDAGRVQVVASMPTDGAEVILSVPFRMSAPEGATSVRVETTGAECIADAPAFECLLDLSEAEAGAYEVSMQAYADDEALGDPSTLRLTKRELAAPCEGDDFTACALARAEAGESAGYEGISYLNADNRHAYVGATDAMTGIDARVYDEPPSAVEADVRLGVMNESRAWTPMGGTCSLVRCYGSRRAIALGAYERNVVYFVPEHRDVGMRDYFMWQSPFTFVSQGSSGSERDEVIKLLQALAIMSTEARDSAEASAALGPLMSMLLLRSRVASDLEHMSGSALPTALPNVASMARTLQLAAAIRPDELPPHARVSSETQDFPEEWVMRRHLASPYALGFAPATTPEETATGTYEIAVQLDTDTDPNGLPLVFFPVVLQDTGGTASIERVDGTNWILRGQLPVDETLASGGQDRVMTRTTVAFFPHNGKWLGTPAMVSVGGRAAEDLATNANNLD